MATDTDALGRIRDYWADGFNLELSVIWLFLFMLTAILHQFAAVELCGPFQGCPATNRQALTLLYWLQWLAAANVINLSDLVAAIAREVRDAVGGQEVGA